MPTYEYACRACDEHFEIVQSFKDDALTECPSCDEGELRKVFSAAGIIFKGSGWHVKDYASPGRSGSNGGGDADASTTKSSSKEGGETSSSSESSSSSSDTSTASSSSGATEKKSA